MCFFLARIDSVDIEITLKLLSVMPKPVFLMTVQEAHEEYNSLTDKIRAKYEQLDSGEFGSPGTPAFDAEACEPTLHKTEPADSKEIIQAHVLQALKMLLVLNAGSLLRVWRMQLCSHRYVRITGLLSSPLVLRIGDWLCVLPAITLVVVKSKKVNKAASSD